jgi:hypothetical protein
MFVRHRQGSAASAGSWDYAEYPDAWSIQEIREDIRDSRYSWADSYRPTEVETVTLPPKEWLEKEVIRIGKAITNQSEQKARYHKLLEEARMNLYHIKDDVDGRDWLVIATCEHDAEVRLAAVLSAPSLTENWTIEQCKHGIVEITADTCIDKY